MSNPTLIHVTAETIKNKPINDLPLKTEKLPAHENKIPKSKYQLSK